MKQIAIEELVSKLDALIKTAPQEKVLLTLKGQPFAFVSDASKYDWEDIGYIADPAFWKMIAERRKEKGGVTLEPVRAKLEQDERAGKRAPGRATDGKKTRTRRSRSAA
jgi:hypothetical protein